MRHGKRTKILSRKKAPRKALMRSLARSLILYEKIRTTEAKAKALKPLIEKIVYLARNNNLTTRRRLISILRDKKIVKKLLEQIGPRYLKRTGGYVRIIKFLPRKTDAAKMALIEFV